MTTNKIKFTINLLDGDVKGRWKVNAGLDDIVAYNIPHTMLPLKENAGLPGINTAGIYFMFGKHDNKTKNGKSEFVYVGKSNLSNGVLSRVKQKHSFEQGNSKKEELYWNNVIIFVKTSTDSDSQLTEDMTGYLEYHLYLDIRAADRYDCQNNATPPSSIKSDDSLDIVIKNIKKSLYILGYTPFERELSDDMYDQKAKYLFLEQKSWQGKKAKGIVDEEGFWVLKGSHIVPDLADYVHPGVKEARKKYKSLIKKMVLTKDILFHSPSYAASFVLGKNANGRVEWKNSKGTKLGDILNDLGEPKKGLAIKNKRKPKKSQNTINVEDKHEQKNIFLSYKQLRASGKLDSKGIIVLKGSSYSLQTAKFCQTYIKNLRKTLVDNKQVKNGKFIKDVLFNSPSTAAACIIGRNTNGRIMWKNSLGKSLKQMDNE